MRSRLPTEVGRKQLLRYGNTSNDSMQRRTKILFADDEPAIRLTLPAILEQDGGFEVKAAATVPEALQLINSEEFDVLLADLNIGERSDGFTLISAMRRVQPNAVTLILTGYPDFETALQAIRSQVDDYMTKPAEISHLVATIKQKLKQPRIAKPLQVKQVSEVLRENIEQIAEEWLKQVNLNPTLSSVQLSRRERLDHIRQIIEELVRRLESDRNVITNSADAGGKHGQQRFKQGYRPRLIAVEARLLHAVISRVIQSHLLSIEMSSLISDIMLVGEALHEQFEESLRAFDEHAGYPKTG